MIKQLFVDASTQRTFYAVPSYRVQPRMQETRTEPDACYLRIWLNDMFLARRRVLYQTRYPVLHAACSILYGGEIQIIPAVATVSQIEGLQGATDRVVNLNHRLLGPIPFVGGDLELAIGLFAVEAENYGRRFADTLSSLSAVAARDELKLALRFLRPLELGIDSLFGLQKVVPHLGMHNTFVSNAKAPQPLRPGYWVVMDAPSGQEETSKLWIKNGRLHRGNDEASATAFEGADYFVFCIEILQQRDDISSLASIRDAWNQTITASLQGNDKELDVAFAGFKSTVLASPDLVWADRVHLIDKLSTRAAEARRVKHRRQFVHTLDTSLEAAIAEAVSVDDAGAISRDQLLSWNCQ